MLQSGYFFAGSKGAKQPLNHPPPNNTSLTGLSALKSNVTDVTESTVNTFKHRNKSGTFVFTQQHKQTLPNNQYVYPI
jgi:hypothetical protein